MDALGTEAAAEERFANSNSLHPRPLTSAALDCQKLDDLWDVASVQIPLRCFTTIGTRTKSKQICSRRLVL